jgi:hypothetical protein
MEEPATLTKARKKDGLKSTVVWSILICVGAIIGAVHFQNVADIPIAQSQFFSSCYNYSPSDTVDRGDCVEAELPAYQSEAKQADDWRNGLIVIAVISGLVFLVSASMLSDRRKESHQKV